MNGPKLTPAPIRYDETRQKPGSYLAIIVEVKGGTSRAGNPMVWVAFKSHTTGFIYPRFCPLSPEGTRDATGDLEKLNQILRSVGHQTLTREQAIRPSGIDVERLLGCSVVISLETEYWDTKHGYRSVITSVRPLSDFKIRVTLPAPTKDPEISL
jgi:hypothetical protein